MDHEIMIRGIFAFLVGLFIGIRMSWQYFANKSVKALDRTFTKPIQSTGERFVQLAGWLWAMSLFVFMFGFGFQHPLPLIVRWIGIVAMIACVPLSVWVYDALDTHLSATLRLLEDHQLVRTGPYKYVRHPMYSTIILCMLGASLASADMFVAAAATLMTVALCLRIPREEAMMQERFGRQWEGYKYYTGALFPKF